MENSICISTCEDFDTLTLYAFIQDTIEEAPLSEIVAYVERSLMAYVVNSWKKVKQFWFVRYMIIKGEEKLALEEFFIDDIARMCGLKD